MKRLQALIESILLFGVVYLVYEIMYFGYMFVVRRGIIEGWSWVDVSAYDGYNLGQISLDYMTDHPVEYTVLSWLLIMAIVVIVVLVTKGHMLKDMSVRWLSVPDFLISIVVGLGIVFAMNGVLILFGEATQYTIDYIPAKIFDSYELTYLVVVAGVMTPIFEELFFRGLLMGRLQKGFGVTAAVVLSAFIFSLSHLNIVQSIFVLPIGILCGVLVVKTGSIFAGIWLHIVYNVVNIYLAKMAVFQYNSLQLLIMVVFGIGLMALGLSQIHERTAQTP